MQRLQTIVATSDADRILKALPLDLHPYIYRFIQDEVKVHYWMKKYNWDDTLYELGQYYDGFHLVRSYFKHVNETSISESAMLHNMNAYREKDKWRDTTGKVTHVEWSWNDDNCDYDKIIPELADMLYIQYEERRDMNGLYKHLSYLIYIFDHMYTSVSIYRI